MQRYFDQSLRLTYGFNHLEALRAFRQAQAIDPDCALCFWGEAFAPGANINAYAGERHVAGLAISAIEPVLGQRPLGDRPAEGQNLGCDRAGGGLDPDHPAGRLLRQQPVQPVRRDPDRARSGRPLPFVQAMWRYERGVARVANS